MARRRLAVVGCGFFSINHLNGWRDLGERCEIVAVCDADPAKARAAAEQFEVPAHYTDAEEMLREARPEFVDIITTVPSHRKLVELCARHKIAAIVQKPLAIDWEDATVLVGSMVKAGVPLMVHENFRFQAPMLRAKEVLASGEIGRPTWARFSWRTNFDVYAGQPYLARETRFILMDIGVHVLDLARFFLGEADEVFCRTNSIKPGIAGEDMATVMLRHESGITSVNDFTYESRQTPEVFPQTLLHIEGTEGSIHMAPDYHMIVTAGAGTRIDRPVPVTPEWGNPRWALVQESVVNTQRHWLDALDAGRDAGISGRDNLKTFALVEACYESARTGLPAKPATFAG